jgi:hypothetical protein
LVLGAVNKNIQVNKELKKKQDANAW